MRPSPALQGDPDPVVALVAHGLADAQWHAISGLLEHFPHQPQGRHRARQEGEGVEEGGIAAVDVDGQYRGAAGHRHAQKARAPFAVAHSLGAQAGDFAGGKDDQGAVLLQVSLNGFKVPARRMAAHVVHGQQ